MSSKDKLDRILQLLSVTLGYACDIYHLAVENNSYICALENRVDKLTSCETQYVALSWLSRMAELSNLETETVNRNMVEVLLNQPNRPIDVDKLARMLEGGSGND